MGRAIGFSEEQIKVLKDIATITGEFADYIYNVMKEAKLTEVCGTKLDMKINPDYKYTTKEIVFGADLNTPSGIFHLAKGKDENEYSLFGINSCEYEILFANEVLREKILEVLRQSKPLPPDSLWIGDDYDHSLLDCGVSVDGLAEA